ncbi:hypothetical protein I2486_18315 [Cellulophaga sp. E16_2]|uniref:Uncharacterized protein n=1 Tax=Cellulophaga algicola (strain DSM 14237 / IC166 / ACAM 630) TaxID=688270 RepID=E6XAL4_CELAD|nr:MULTISPECIES: hypothetical protein [Cellulophaga]ADV50976.1 hypothetical protein Celal_3722 [Cellulophaga algicola DSM 14237]MBO0593361.1 hypothetical protein [Cellulophaga sp. E16_2]
MLQTVIDEINSFLKVHSWCDFEIIELKGNLMIGGKTSFEDRYDIIITFEDVFFIQCNYEWKTDTDLTTFSIPDIEERRKVNIDFSIESGYTLFKINAEEINQPFYISSVGIKIKLQS